MDHVAGTRGYEDVIGSFISVSLALDFARINEDFLPFLPSSPGRILDAGAGAGQNAAALAKAGHSVVAVEPFLPFLQAARGAYGDLGITWLHDSLPLLQALTDPAESYDFILVDGVWHHLSEPERAASLQRFASLLRSGGHCAISLRNGPPGGGKHVFPTDSHATIALAQRCGFEVALHLENQPSKAPGKPGVTWSRLVLTRR